MNRVARTNSRTGAERGRVRVALVLAIMALVSVFAVAPTNAAPPTDLPAPGEGEEHSHGEARPPQEDRARGMHYGGLRQNPDGPCGTHGFELQTHGAANRPECTHGPDPAPAGIDVTQQRPPLPQQAAPQAETQVDARRSAPPVTVPDERGDGQPLDSSTAGGTAETSAASTASSSNTVTNYPGQIKCSGDGWEGYRTQVIYAHASDKPQRYWSYVDSIRSWMRNGVDYVYDNSAAETGGERHVRFVTFKKSDGTCDVSVYYAQLSPTGDDNFSNTINELRAKGYNRNDRKYLVMMDANVYCGIGQIYGDDRPGTDNWNDGNVSMFSRVDNGCWGIPGHSVEAHELMHNMGGVQQSAPYRTPGWHCWDEYDLMCYDDDGAGGYSMVTYCSDPAHNNRFDCNHNTYYHTSPPSGSYLDTKWNAARSRFLIRCGWYYNWWGGYWYYACTS